jgi:hypothetical protein
VGVAHNISYLMKPSIAHLNEKPGQEAIETKDIITA